MDQQHRNDPAQSQASIVGAWRVNAEGAPFVPHVALFHADGTLLIHNPDAGNPHTSDSLGVGVWQVVGERSDTIRGVFEEASADRDTHQPGNWLRVTFTLTLEGINTFRGQASATYSAPDGTLLPDPLHQATLKGVRILP